MSTPVYDAPDPSAAAQRARLRLEEYSALRATIRERGTRRMTLVAAVFIAWAALFTATEIWVATPFSTLIPLLVLAAGFEATFAMHVGVERIGRYLQVEYEGGEGGPAWEHTAMRFGATPTPAAGRVDPLFSMMFASATALNMVPVVLMTLSISGAFGELGIVTVAHGIFVARILRARKFAAQQRELDLAALTRQASS
jgi:hypothetical protein